VLNKLWGRAGKWADPNQAKKWPQKDWVPFILPIDHSDAFAGRETYYPAIGTMDQPSDTFEPMSDIKFEVDSEKERRIVNWFMLILAASSFSLIFLAVINSDTSLAFGEKGITFPSTFLIQLKGRLRRDWSELVAVDIKQRRYFGPELILTLSKTKVSFNLVGISDEDLTNFFLALDKWGTKTRLAPEVIALRHRVMKQAALSSAANKSSTAMWEEELRFHFSATNFVPLEQGAVIKDNHFKILTQLGAGGLSAVYLAQCEDKVVVLKECVIPPSCDEKTRQKAKEMFAREAQLLLKVNHPQIAKVYDHFVDQGRDYLVLEYVPGSTLRDLIRRHGRQDEISVRKWAIQIADILNYLHTMTPALVHRDITPDNIILGSDGTIHLVDFGAANELVGTATGTMVGKQLYISPEQFKGKAEAASDLYSLGATMHFLLTGSEPEALSPSRPKDAIADVSDDMNSIVERLTQLDPSQRIHTAAELKGVLEMGNASAEPGKSTTSDNPISAGDSEGLTIDLAQKEKEKVSLAS
jgi:tRNA A-37 threonylcarbamoyl transferase component Bud32